MSGIAVICANDSPTLLDEEKPDLIRKVLKRLRHRGSNNESIYKTPNAVLGYTTFKSADEHCSSKQIAITDGRVLGISKNNNEISRNKVSKDEKLLKLYLKYGKGCVRYMNGPFALAVNDGKDIFIARDHLGLKPLYYGRLDGKLIFASEIKALIPFVEEINTFPPGNYFHSKEGFKSYFSGVKHKYLVSSKEKAARDIKKLLIRSVRRRTAGIKKLGIYLSGGIDSSVLVAAAAKVNYKLKTFAVGTKGSRDLQKAKIVADYLDTDHYQYQYDLDDIFKYISEVIFQLESFDQYLVRSSIANFFVGRLAREHGVELVLCGEGGDELFGGYHYLKEFEDDKQIMEELEKLTMTGHANGFQRVDRMNMAHSLLYDMPFMDQEVREYAFMIPVEWKIYGDNEPVEKWILRKAFDRELPAEIIWREKEKFFKGSNTTAKIKDIIEQSITDEEYEREKIITENFTLRSKEELYYYRIFRQYYPHKSILNTIGRTSTI